MMSTTKKKTSNHLYKLVPELVGFGVEGGSEMVVVVAGFGGDIIVGGGVAVRVCMASFRFLLEAIHSLILGLTQSGRSFTSSADGDASSSAGSASFFSSSDEDGGAGEELDSSSIGVGSDIWAFLLSLKTAKFSLSCWKILSDSSRSANRVVSHRV